MIRSENLTKVYRGITAVDGINFSVGKGDVCGFLGPNGAGKTTTICMMVGQVEPTAGRCFIKDIEVARNPLQVKKLIGYLPEGIGFYSNMTGAQNLRYFSKFYDLKEPAIGQKITELLDYVGLSNVGKPVGAYSKGMKQRLGLARALLNDPAVIFLDEPTSGLDPEGVVQFRKIIKEQAAAGRTVFFSSHSISEVEHVCNTLCIISRGRIVASGSMEDVRRKLRRNETITIKITTNGSIPELSDPRIVSATYDGCSATIKATSDIRDALVDELQKKNLRLRELTVEKEQLEELFLETVYGSH